MNKKNVIDISSNIKNFREKRGMTQDGVAKFCGVSDAYVSMLENKDKGRIPSLEIILRLCDLFGCTPNDLLLKK